MKIVAARVLLVCLLSSGCATASFAPPVVNLDKKTTVVSSEGRPCSAQIERTADPIGQDVDGARGLIDNFIYVYRCRAQSAANGRQLFEVPQLLLAAGGAIAAAYGAGPNVAIGTGSAGAVFSRGQNYYDPKQKAAIYDHALDALLCIKLEAVGVTPFTTSVNDVRALAGGGDTVTVSAEQRYYDMVMGALLSVERILGQRLSSTGTFDPAGLITEIDAVQKKVDEANAKSPPAPAPVALRASSASGVSASPEISGFMFLGSVISRDQAIAVMQSNFTLDLDVLQPKIQKCILRAKL